MMSDFEYDCWQRKRLAQQAKYRKCGSKSKKCSMSTDHMTQKQWKERNGKVVTVNLNQPITWDEFKALTTSMQEEYLRHMMENYGANATSFAAMFGVQPLTIRRHIQMNKLNIKFPVGHSMSTAQRMRGMNCCTGKHLMRVSKQKQKMYQLPSWTKQLPNRVWI